MVVRYSTVGGHEVVKSGTFISEGFDVIGIYLFDEIDVRFDFSIDIIDGKEETEVRHENDVVTIINKRDWFDGDKSASLNTLDISEDEEFIYYFNYWVDIMGDRCEFVYKLTYIVTRNRK